MNGEICGLGWVKFKGNLFSFFSENSVYIILWSFTAVLDAYSTTMFMKVLGPESEIHPITRFCSYKAGVDSGPLIAGFLKFAIALPLLVCWKNISKYILTAGCFLQVYAYYHNMKVYETYSNMKRIYWFQ